jgi:hypothetical protein
MPKGMSTTRQIVFFYEIEAALWHGAAAFKSNHGDPAEETIFSPEFVIAVMMECADLFDEDLPDDNRDTRIQQALATGYGKFCRNYPVMAKRAGKLSDAFEVLGAEIAQLMIQKKTSPNG